MSRALRACAVLTAALALAGCQRRPQLVPASADSTAAAGDSFAVYARLAADRWESGADDEAALHSVRLVREALLVRPNAPWAERTRGVFDSLGIAAEVAGGDPAEVINLFSRARPDADSWPFLLWRERGEPRFQGLEARALHLVDVATRQFAGFGEPSDSAQTAVLWSRRVAGGQQPLLMVWRRAAGGRWDLLQTLGADSLGGTGSGEFAATDSASELTVRTYRPAPYFDECATCPHVFHERRFAWREGGFKRVDESAVPTPYSTFTGFIAALVAGDRARAQGYVVDKALIDFARRYDWHRPDLGRWRVAPATDETAIEMVFLRGASDAFRVRFEARENDWIIAGFEPASRVIE